MRDVIKLDFAGYRPRVSIVGAVLLTLGALSAVAVALEYRVTGERRAALELRVAALASAKNPVVDPSEAAANSRIAVSVEQAARDLATPWTLLLSELEQASKDLQGQVALLGVEPDHAKHSVRVSAEARTMSLAIAYVERLQNSRSIEYPMLDRHEVRADDAQHPVSFELTGAWRDNP